MTQKEKRMAEQTVAELSRKVEDQDEQISIQTREKEIAVAEGERLRRDLRN